MRLTVRIAIICLIGLTAGFLLLSGEPVARSDRIPIDTNPDLPGGHYLKLIKNIDPVCDSVVGNFKQNIEAGLGVDILNNEIFWEHNSEKPCYIASLTKLMVALIVMEKVEKGELKLTDTIAVTDEATKIGGSRVYLKKGEVFTLEELLKAMIIYSANDASYLVAQHIGSSEKEFVKMMNNRAWELGLSHTRFWNVTGLPPKKSASGGEEGNHNISTCVELAKIAFEVIKYPKIKEWASTKEDYLRNGEFKLTTKNSVMKYCALVDGLKTGYYPEAGWSIVATSLNGTHKVMVIVLGAKSRKARGYIAQHLIEYTVVNPTIDINRKIDL